MIEITPMKNRTEELQLLNRLNRAVDNARILEMSERTSVLGWIAVAIKNNTLYILDFHTADECSVSETEFYMDTLMRAAASYGETNGSDTIETTDARYNEFLKRKGFMVDEFHAFTPMSTIVHYTK